MHTSGSEENPVMGFCEKYGRLGDSLRIYTRVKRRSLWNGVFKSVWIPL